MPHIQTISGKIATADKPFIGTISFDNTGIITNVDIGYQPNADYAYSTDDCLIFAGFGDIHIHAREDISDQHTYKEDFCSAGNAAIHGGVCHLADMPNNPVAPVDDLTYQEKLKLSKKAPIHITLYAGIGPGTQPLQKNVPYKVFMGPSVGDLYFKNNQDLEQVIRHYRGQNISFHCEDPILLQESANQPLHEDRRPAQAEITATDFALYLIETYQLHGKLCHFSTADGLKKIIAAKKRGVAVTCEATPTHLFFDRSMLTSENARWLQMNPPLRSREDKEFLLAAFQNGDIDYLASDHAPHSIEEKQQGTSGVSHLDTYGLFITYLLLEKKISATRIALTCSQNPGDFVKPYLPEAFGKGIGRMEPGYAANFSVLNLKRKTHFTREMVVSKSGWSPFEGFTFPGSIEALIYLGKPIRGNQP